MNWLKRLFIKTEPETIVLNLPTLQEKFFYLQKVKVIGGFYRGQTGILIEKAFDNPNRYMLKMNSDIIKFFHAFELEAIDD